MFKLISKIDNVRDYVIYKGKPYYINTSDEIQCGEKKQMLYKTPLSPLATFNGKFYCSEWENNYKIFDENLELIEEGKDKAFLYLSKEFLETYFLDEQQKIFITALLDREENLIVLGNIDKFSISFSQMGIYIYIYKKNKIYDDVMSIRAFSIQKKKHLWEFSLSSLGKGKDYNTDEEFNYEVEQFVGIYNNILWVYIERGGFIGLDIQTGELKHRILGIPKGNLLGKVDSYVDSEEFYIFYRAKFILDEKKGIIIGLIADRFFEIDLNKEKITPMLYGMWDKMEKMNLKKYGVSGNTSLQEDLLYFYNDKELQFGVLDINTKEFIYVSEPIAVVERDDSFTRLRDLKVSENKVYILDSNHTLHIFEREQH
ncbi:hypothetical protein [Capnocytophaga genosp. AHN8471]|uniref:hypothetical protein n=1 Tax=Capnocytophaga genosp. AHN8471 TaxID=327574 RepID=UPI001EE43588|nr:hypothetical protein [Capnocytophaga genosp. AHN8471]